MKKIAYLLILSALLAVSLTACKQSGITRPTEESSMQSAVAEQSNKESSQENKPMTESSDQSDYEESSQTSPTSQPEFIPPIQTEISDYQSIVVNDKCRLLLYTGTENRIIVPDKVTVDGKEYETEIGAGCFKEKEIISLTLPDNVTEIPESMCENCKQLEEITFFNVQSIGKNAFWQCENLKFRLDDINGGDWTKLKKVGECAFGFSGLYGKVTVRPDMELEDGSFQVCLHVQEVEIQNGITEIPNRLFAENSALEKITLPDTLTKINPYAFSENIVKNIIIPQSVTEIGSHAITTDKVAGGKYTGIILGYKGSAAEAYAKENNIVFSPLN